MKRTFVLALLAVLFLTSCGASDGALSVQNAWARAAMQGENSAAYMLIRNGTDSPYELVGASSDFAASTELHLSKMVNDVMQMIPQDVVPLPAGEDVEFKPGGLHVMFVGLKRDLKVGEEIKLTLKFKNHPDLTLTVPVKDAGAMGGSGMDGHKMP